MVADYPLRRAATLPRWVTSLSAEEHEALRDVVRRSP